MVTTATNSTIADPINNIPDPATLRAMLTESVRRSELLRALIRISNRKAILLPKATPPTPATVVAAR